MYGQLEPDFSSVLSLIHHLNADELKRLLNEEERCNEFIKDAQQVRSVEIEKEMLMASNKSLAEFNLSREPRLSQAKSQLAETYEKAVSVFSEAEVKKKELEDASKQNSLDTTLAILQTAAAQSEEESENIAEKFLDGGLDVETFLDEFQSKRKVAHLRRIKVDKMTELLNTSNRAAVTPTANNSNWGYGGGGGGGIGIYGNQQQQQMPMMRMPPGSNYGHRM